MRSKSLWGSWRKREWRSTGLGLAAATLLAVGASAQVYGDGHDGVLAPTSDITLDTAANGGVFHFTSIQIPAGVTVRLVGPNPAQFLCQGAVNVAGRIDANAPGALWLFSGGQHISNQDAGPGGYRGGGGNESGFGPGGGDWGNGSYPVVMGASGSHATVGSPNNPFLSPAPTYGSHLPFDLQGGSGGGGPGTANANDYGPASTGGGGTVVILADGPIDVSGSISARGGDQIMGPEYAWISLPAIGGLGSGGAILLRSLQCLRVSGQIDATGGSRYFLGQQPTPSGGAGFVRLDSYTACGVPDVTGAVIRPAPYLAPMPFLTALEPARIGQTYRARCASAPGDVLGFYYSLGTGNLPLPPFGVLELDTSLLLFFGQHTVPTVGHDPLAAIDIPVPAMPGLVGLTFHAQVFNAFGTVTGHARLSNRLDVTIGL